MGSGQGDTPTPEQYEYFVQHSGDSRVAGIIACATISAFLGAVFVLLRLVGRRLIHHRWCVHASDGLLMVSWTAIITEVSYSMSMAFLKLSILALYGSIFPSRRFHQCLWALGVFTVLWCLTSAIGSICQCVPVESFWDDSVEGHCIDFGILQLTCTICNITTDFIILFLPVGQIRRLHVSKAKKRWIHFSLAMGGSACVVSIVRLVFALQVGSIDASWADIPAAWASEAELCVGFLVVSIPTYQPIYRRLVYGSADALHVRTGKAYQFQPWSRKSKSHLSHVAKASSQSTLSPMPLGISVADDVQPVRHTQHVATWVGQPGTELRKGIRF
ncbi:hypothetical protein KVR01_010385 [Diaporthe batatas]|uniref:uncharacterized protein n=1 Tax=Diaporthe batatas TaxID=748121 RepID=UPI001D039B25|nr:uncharacterized protein KVR01_010385 [Diaporthe batatas]KAG8159748.1 hypothetical protein KVR01_010385 [Diaporthe batatas]